LKAEIEKKVPDVEVELISSGGGVFEVTCDGKLIFSKKELGRFPENEEILSQLH
jgi:selenoprotein W-related protein